MEIDLKVARRLYNSGDKEFKELALSQYNEEELEFPEAKTLLNNFNNNKNKVHTLNRAVKRHKLLAAIAYYIYGNEIDEMRDRKWGIVEDSSTGELCSCVLTFTHANDILFDTMNDANYAINLLNVLEREI